MDCLTSDMLCMIFILGVYGDEVVCASVSLPIIFATICMCDWPNKKRQEPKKNITKKNLWEVQ